jgi:hypothetical protein
VSSGTCVERPDDVECLVTGGVEMARKKQAKKGKGNPKKEAKRPAAVEELVFGAEPERAAQPTAPARRLGWASRRSCQTPARRPRRKRSPEKAFRSLT